MTENDEEARRTARHLREEGDREGLETSPRHEEGEKHFSLCQPQWASRLYERHRRKHKVQCADGRHRN